TGGLLLHNAVVHLGQSTSGQFAQLNFSSAGSQSLDAVPGSTGIIDLGLSANNGISFSGSLTGDHFTIGAPPARHGTARSISVGSAYRLDNKGTITADPTILGTSAGTVTINGGSNWLNEGTIQAANGGSLSLAGTSSATANAWTNTAGHSITISGGGTLTLGGPGTPPGPPRHPNGKGSTWLKQGTISETDSTVNLGGSAFTMTALGTFVRVGGPTHGTVNLSGTLANSGQTMLFNDTTGSWVLQNG